MGSGSSKPAAPRAPTFTPDYSTATFSAADVQRQLSAATQQAQDSVQQAVESTAASTSAAISGFYKPILWLLVIVVVGLALIFLADYISIKITGKELSGFGWLEAPQAPPEETPQYEKLYISYARYGTDSTVDYKDVTQHVASMIVGDTTLPPFVVSASNLGLNPDPYKGNAANLYIQYFTGTNAYIDAVYNEGSTTDELPVRTTANTSAKNVPKPKKAVPPPGLASRIYNSIFGDSSGNLAPSFHDATTSAIIQGKQAPLSSQSEGGYGMQWWMYIKDWNYGYGKKKGIIKRPDSTNSAVTNPSISLHPTDNTLQISVSVYPSTEGGASKSTPAPAGHSGSTDDVFVCDVPNIPLQTWFSVSVTVFGRNLDVYIDGKLVKSCFLSGVPKPAVGDIQLTPEGGFSGRVCDFYHYPRMLTPADTSKFYDAGTKCRNQTPTGGSSSAGTGYSIKFGMYDSLGKEVQEYTF